MVWCLSARADYEVLPTHAPILAIQPDLLPNVIPGARGGLVDVDSSILKDAADRYGINYRVFAFIAFHESQNDPAAVGDKDFVCNLPRSPIFGEISPSYGLFQINLCAHPDVSVSDAENPFFAARWAAQQIAAGNINQWTAWRDRCALYPYDSPPNCQ